MSVNDPPAREVGLDVLDFHRRASAATRQILARIQRPHRTAPTNCDMDVRGLVNHLVSGHLWAAALTEGRTIGEVGDRFDGDLLRDDPIDAYDRSLATAQSAFSAPGALERTCVVSYGEVPVAVFCGHRALDTFIHGWDIARATGQDDTLDRELVEETWRLFEPHAAEFAASPAFGPPLQVDARASTQTRLLAMLGRDSRQCES